MPEINDLLDAERNRRRPAARRARVALIVASAATVVALGTGPTLAATAATSLIKHEEEASAVDDFVAPVLEQRTPTAEPSPSTNEPSATEPPGIAQPTQNEFGFPVYDSTTASRPSPDRSMTPTRGTPRSGSHSRASSPTACRRRAWNTATQATGWCLQRVTWEQHQAALDQAQVGTAEFEALYGVAEFGPDDPEVAPEYRWEDAGCHGYAVHVTGMDDAH